MANMATRISIYADDKASASFRRVGGEADSLAKKIDALNALGPGLRNVFAGLRDSLDLRDILEIETFCAKLEQPEVTEGN